MLENRDIDILQSRFSNITERIVPLNNFGSFRCAYEDASEDFSVVGTHKGYFQCIPQKQLFGRYLNEMDVREQRKVCVIGYQVYRSLFKRGGDPCGKLIKAGELYYTIVGVVRESSGMINLGAGVNESIHIPLTTGQNTYGQGDMIHALIVTLKDDAPAQEWEDKILRVVKEIQSDSAVSCRTEILNGLHTGCPPHACFGSIRNRLICQCGRFPNEPSGFLENPEVLSGQSRH